MRKSLLLAVLLPALMVACGQNADRDAEDTLVSRAPDGLAPKAARPSESSGPAPAGCPAAAETTDGDLKAYLDAQPLVPARSEGFQVPSPEALAQFESAFRALATGPDDAAVRALTSLGFEVRCFPAPGVLVIEDANGARGAGTFALHLAPARQAWLEVPHAGFDGGTLEQGSSAFLALSARALVITGSHRCANAQVTPCSGKTAVCGGALRISDVAHSEQNFFTAAHRALRTTFPSAVAVSLHGMDTPGGEVAVFSDGTTAARSSGATLRVRDALNARLPGGQRAYSCNDRGDDDQYRPLCGTTNVQGRIDNGSAAACTVAATRSDGRFLHVEQGPELRGVAPSAVTPRHLIDALAEALAP